MKKPRIVNCPVCGKTFILEETIQAGEVVNCPECGWDLKIISVNPPTVEEKEVDELTDDYDQKYTKKDHFKKIKKPLKESLNVFLVFFFILGLFSLSCVWGQSVLKITVEVGRCV